MPIVFNYPPDARLGPGFQFTITTSTAGPWPTDALWEIIWWLDADGVDKTIVDQRPAPFPNGLTVGILGLIGEDWFKLTGTPYVFDGAANKIDVRLWSPTLGVQETMTQTVTTDLVTGLQLQAVTEQDLVATSSGLTPAQATELSDVRLATWMRASPNLEIPFSELGAPQPPSGFLRRQTITPDRTDTGELVPPTGLNAAYGLAWDFISWPDGIGLNQGRPGTFDIDMLNLNSHHTLSDGTVYESDWVVARVTNASWWPREARPSLIQYWIAPGVVCRFYWHVVIEP